jgi:hypothetical protein
MSRTFLSCLDCLKMERRVRAQWPAFRYYLVIGENLSARAAFAFAGAENALVSFHYVGRSDIAADLREFALDPAAACERGQLAEYMEALRSACGG